MPKIIFHKLVPVTLDVPDHCPKCHACLHGAFLDKHGKPLNDAERFGTHGSSRYEQNGGNGPLAGIAWDTSCFTGRLTGKDGPGDDDNVLNTNSLEYLSADKNPLQQISCTACGYAWQPDSDDAKPAEGDGATTDEIDALVAECRRATNDQLNAFLAQASNELLAAPTFFNRARVYAAQTEKARRGNHGK